MFNPIARYIHRAVVFAALLAWSVIAAAPTEAMRVIDWPDTPQKGDSPQTVLTIYNETDAHVQINWLPGNHYTYVLDNRVYDADYNDIKGLQNSFVDRPNSYFIAPHDRFEYVGLLGPCPGIVRDGKVGEWGIGIQPPNSNLATKFRFWLHGDNGMGNTTPYDLDWGEGSPQEQVKNWITRPGHEIPNSGGLKSVAKDRLERFAVQSRINDKWYIVSLMLGHRASGNFDSNPSHLVIVIQEADPEMQPIND